MARPMLQIDADQVYKLAKLHCTIREIADFFGCSEDTIKNRFKDELAAGKADGKKKLRDLQWKAAEKGNVSMLIWLGKQYLGQKDKSDEEIEAIKQSAGPMDKEKLIELVKAARGAA